MNLELIGIPKAKINQLNSKGIYSIEDLIKFFPHKYYDFRNPKKIKYLKDGEYQSVVAKVESIKETNGSIFIRVVDTEGSHMNINFFKRSYIKKMIKVGVYYIFCGKVKINKNYYNAKSMDNPLTFSDNIESCKKIQPVYSKIKNMSEEYLLKSVNSALALIDKADYVEPRLLNKFGLITYANALRGIHQPTNIEQINLSKERFLFDDLFFYNMRLMSQTTTSSKTSSYKMTRYNKSKELMDNLPFELTDGQRLALRHMCKSMKNGDRLNALVQGDVGSGKTLVACLLMVVSSNNGYQSALLAPTEILARQHYMEIKEKVEPLGFKVAYLSAGIKSKKERKKLLADLKDGSYDMIVGTHSILSSDVEFKNLAITIVDEEHRFGVIQRNCLKEKAQEGVHTITMSATPVPRSLAMAMYGDDMDVVTINSMPKGRKPVRTIHIKDEHIAYEKIYEQVQKGHQCYVVCPLTEDSYEGSMAGIESVETTYRNLCRYFKDKNINIAMVIGGKKMTNKEREDVLSEFTNGKIDILIATTIIEVGVNVPNSTVILIKNAERFGLAQLHQLRGRVGRGNFEGHCLLLSDCDKLGNAKKKIEVMCNTNNGFIIAEKDLEIRGAGEFLGTQQSGTSKYVMLMMANMDLHMKIKKEVEDIFEDMSRYSRYKYMLSEEFDYLV